MAMYFKSGRRFGKFKNEVKNFTDELKRDFNKRTRQAALSIMNDLAKKGPEWDGTFKNSWVAIPLGKGGTAKNGTYPYKISDIPQLSIDQAEFSRANKLEISNTSTYAEFALDLRPGKFSHPNFPRKERGKEPKGKVVKTGTRDNTRETFRGEISGGGGNSKITAPLDWYTTYLKGGGLQKSIGKGISFGNR